MRATRPAQNRSCRSCCSRRTSPPTPKALADRDFWKDPKDPHKTEVYRQYTQSPFVPMPSVLNPGFTQLQNENVFAKAIGRIVVDKWDSQRAIDEMIARIKAVAG